MKLPTPINNLEDKLGMDVKLAKVDSDLNFSFGEWLATQPTHYREILMRLKQLGLQPNSIILNIEKATSNYVELAKFTLSSTYIKNPLIVVHHIERISKCPIPVSSLKLILLIIDYTKGSYVPVGETVTDILLNFTTYLGDTKAKERFYDSRFQIFALIACHESGKVSEYDELCKMLLMPMQERYSKILDYKELYVMCIASGHDMWMYNQLNLEPEDYYDLLAKLDKTPYTLTARLLNLLISS